MSDSIRAMSATLFLIVAICARSGAETDPEQNSSAQAFSVAAILTHNEALDRPHDIELRGDFAYVPGKGGSLANVDISEPATPKLVWHRRDPNGLDDAETVLPVGDNRLFLGTNDFHLVDVTKISAPVFQTKITDRSGLPESMAWFGRTAGSSQPASTDGSTCLTSAS